MSTAMLERGQCLAEGSFIETHLFGYELLNDPLLNKGTAFTEEERDAFELHGLLPPRVATLDAQVSPPPAGAASIAERSFALHFPARAAGHQRGPALRAAR